VDFISRYWQDLTGLYTDDALGWKWETAVHPDDRSRYLAEWRAALDSKQKMEAEVRLVRADGEYRWFLARNVPLWDESGNIFRWYGVATDIEDRKRAEQGRERLRQVEADLAHINRVSMMGELAASIAHELKQPIAVATLQAEICLQWLRRDHPHVREAGEAATRILDAANRADEIIDHLRSLYKKSPAKRELVDANQSISQMVALLLEQATRHVVSIHTDFADGLPEILADRVQFQQVLMNLMLNAIEAMHDTGGVLTVKSQLSHGDWVEISVSDTGTGLPAGKDEEIFNAFFTTKTQGSGMGLSISRSIVESHGGRLWAINNEGRGATFVFALPIAADAQLLAAV
jgi:PAS domain S-box-containing protein